MSGASAASPGARPLPVLWAITELDRAPAERWVERLGELCRAARPGTVAVQLRDRERSARERLAFGRALRALTAASGQWLAVNDRIDLALALDADALHLGEASVSVAEARALWGERCVTRAVHAVGDGEGASAVRAPPASADALLLSPVLAGRKGAPALGLGALERACHRLAPTPVLALGGVDAGSAAACLRAGAVGVAVLGAVLDEPDPRALVAALGLTRYSGQA